MSISPFDVASLIETFQQRMEVGAENDVCAHLVFPEVGDDPSTLGLISMLMETLVIAYESGQVEILGPAAEHALVVAAAYGFALGGLSAIADAANDPDDTGLSGLFFDVDFDAVDDDEDDGGWN